LPEHNASQKPVEIVAIAGPTATGKTETAAELAERLGGEIICADSMQIYRGLDIGTAMPPASCMARIPHHLYGYVEPTERYSVARYVADASRAALEIAGRGALPILCGGTGLYISSFLRGLSFTGPASDPERRRRIYRELETKGARALIEEVARAEPESAAALQEGDARRIVRAVELLRAGGYSTGRQNALSEPREKLFLPHLAILNCSDRKIMYNRIGLRVDGMLSRGLLAEARYVYENRALFHTAAQAIGYKEFFGYFEGADSLDSCVDRLKQATRRYAKRQLTWFRREKGAVWYRAGDVSPGEVAENIKNNIKKDG
jgi:tRNA dimethylallyltransferase